MVLQIDRVEAVPRHVRDHGLPCERDLRARNQRPEREIDLLTRHEPLVEAAELIEQRAPSEHAVELADLVLDFGKRGSCERHVHEPMPLGQLDKHDARLVVGTYGESPLRGAMLGSTPHKLLHW